MLQTKARAWQQLVNPHNLELVRDHYITKAEQNYSGQQTVHLKMARLGRNM
jgi:hypothetical protein